MNFDLIVNYLYENTDSTTYDKEILKYGLEVLIYNIFTIFNMIFISVLFNKVDFGLVFIPIFTVLRLMIGGFHCKTVIGCTILMITIYVNIIMLNNFANFQHLLTFIAPILIFLLIFIKQCDENIIHLLNYNVCYKYFLIVLYSISYIILDRKNIFNASFSALLIVEIMYLMNLIKIRIKYKKHLDNVFEKRSL